MRGPDRWKIYHLLAAASVTCGVLVFHRRERERCLRLSSSGTDSETKICMQEIYQEVFSGTTPVRK